MTASSDRNRRLGRTVRIGWLLLLSALAALSWQAASAAWGDRAADSVVGQGNFTSRVASSSPSGLENPTGIAVDQSSGRLFVADRNNHRVQGWLHADSFALGQAADFSIFSDGHGSLELDPVATATDSSGNLYIAELVNSRVIVCPPASMYAPCTHVIGQQYFTSTLPNQGWDNPSAHTLSGPISVATDGSNHLFVADFLNNRVLRYTLPIVTDNQAADVVLGQPNMTSSQINRGNGDAPATANGLYWPQGLAADSTGNLFVADTYNHRVLRFNTPLSDGKAANLVLGQTNFTSNSINAGRGRGSPTATTMDSPNSLVVDHLNRLYVADNMNTRVIGFELRGLTSGDAAKIVVGQPDFGPAGYAPTGSPSDVSLAQPSGVAVDIKSNLYVADTVANRALRYDFPWPLVQQLPMISK